MSEHNEKKYSLICVNCKKETTHLLNDMCLDCYFTLNSPTKTNNISWIFLPAPRRVRASVENYVDELIIKDDIAKHIIEKNYILNKKDSLIRVGNKSFQFTVEGIDELANKTGILIGKWLIYRNELEIDVLWSHIGKAVLKGKLGISAKVSTAYSKSKRYVICVYTYNYLDVEDVDKVRKGLSALGVKETLCYKPDIYTYLDIYSGRSKLSPCRYRK